MTHAQRLADFVVRASYHDFSASALAQLKLHVLDTIGCAIGALDGPPIRAVRQHVRELGGRAQCTLIGGGRSSVDRVLAARGDEAALSAKQPAQRRAVEDHEMDQQPFHVASRFCHSLCSLSINALSSR